MAKVQVGLKLEPELVAEVDGRASAVGMTRTEAVEEALRRWLDGPEASAVLDTLPKSEDRPKSAPKAKPPAGFRKASPVVKVQPAASPTPSAPEAGAARVRDIDLPVGRERPAYGAMMKGGGKARR